MGYRPDDSFFDGKEVSVNRMNKWNLETLTLLDVSDAVKRSGAIDFEKILMLRNDEGKWALYLKPENEKSFSVYPEKADLNLFFTTVKQGDEETSEKVRQDMAQNTIWPPRTVRTLRLTSSKVMQQQKNSQG